MDVVAHIHAGQPTETPWRFQLDEMAWRDLVEGLKHDSLPFVGLWCDGVAVHALFMPHGTQPLAASLMLEGGRYPALSPARAVSSLYERMIFDLYGAEAMWATDVRPLVDHDVWAETMPLAAAPGGAGSNKTMLTFQPSEAMQAAGGVTAGSGPASGGRESPLHIALALDGDVIRYAETVTGYAHRGMAQRLKTCRVEDANRLTGRYVAGACAAHQAAFCQAVEAACGESMGPEVSLLRVVVLELERVSTHLFTLAGIARQAGAVLVASRCMWFREKLLTEAAPIIGSRLMMDHCVPGGVNLRTAAAMGELCSKLAELGEEIYPDLVTLWQSYPGLSSRLVGLGVVDSALLEQVGLDGPVARAGGGDCDYRRDMRAYDGLWRFTSGRHDGAVEDRAIILLEEVGESLRMLNTAGPKLGLSAGGRIDLYYEDGEGIGMAEGPWGAVLYWVRLKDGRVEHAFVRDPAYSSLLALEAVLPGQNVADLGLIRASLGVTASALDG
ncbi:formate hydrogenlyase/hydrogenase/NADH dehydrogenase subunit [Acetobacter cibinongensis]|uniref:Formate hydrogenlyase/hydrogenase/NADH dehydrogenase subunit n=1 Tax=Acetobacter cibinongensis TaxID=146475 RepID=A0A0D6N3U0_9PROT|nr:NADH-ubiquinone oxidoreductase [Acetobacter cibinongensis]GAN60186.1 NADH-ubiquinone oxidoreductase 49kDa subunit [Acetobacter cibinongensis]GBQ18015.1 NADH-ubiquinone oxidoreductase 49kDa subunit [Acetobacter cibinongensis NRIC 0482]GEL58318.1 formate hydrogenlyase/hydrogenase/NADH dehydrogenase subunit [Acetobacter cibinongensis]